MGLYCLYLGMKYITISTKKDWSKNTLSDVINVFSKPKKQSVLDSFITVVWDGKNNLFCTTFCAN